MDGKQFSKGSRLLRPIVDNECGRLQYEFIDGLPVIHLMVWKWSKEKYKDFLAIWREVLDYFNDEGHETVYCIVPSRDKKLIKFERMFGFTDLFEADGILVMERSTKKWE